MTSEHAIIKTRIDEIRVGRSMLRSIVVVTAWAAVACGSGAVAVTGCGRHGIIFYIFMVMVPHQGLCVGYCVGYLWIYVVMVMSSTQGQRSLSTDRAVRN